MKLKIFLSILLILVSVIVANSYLVTTVNVTQALQPFSKVGSDNGENVIKAEGGIEFVDRELETGWMPWIIKQMSILIGGLSLIVFFYAGVNLIVKGDNEEEYGKAIRVLIYSVVGIALAAFSYSIVANVLQLFSG